MSENRQVQLTQSPITTGPSSLIPDMASWREQWLKALNDPSGFWLDKTSDLLQWEQAPKLGCEGDFWSVQQEPIRWFADGTLNVSVNCVDRHLEQRGEQAAIIWEADEPGQSVTWTYRDLHEEVCRAANVLSDLGVKAGDRVIIYMGMVPQAAAAMLACARIGAAHSVVFGGFSAEALRDRIIDCGARVVITQDEGRRGGRPVALKSVVDEALSSAEAQVDKVLVYKRTQAEVFWDEERDVDWVTACAAVSAEHNAQSFAAEHPLFILYTSGSTGRPKGLMHTSGGYLTYTTFTHRAVFDLREGDVYGCVADVGWITGHSYIVYGPLSNGTTTVMFESTPLYPDAGRYWSLVEQHKINIFYTAPTAIRALAAKGDGFVSKYDLSSLRVLGTVGEPINPEAWEWYYNVVGQGKCALVDTWWQTETGGISLSPLAGVTPTQAGAATLPLPGIQPVLLNPESQLIHGPGEGRLCLNMPWPGQARTVWGDHERFVKTYFSDFPGRYFTGDGCRRDEYGHHWITGRVDDVLNVSGHRMGTAEFEAALITDDLVAEAAVVGFPHPVKGQGVCAYLVLRSADQTFGALADDILVRLQGVVRARIGVHAKLDRAIRIPGLPKTRSGKVMRRILRKVAEGETKALGDVSTLADSAVVEAIIKAASKV
ncbi:MAG: acetate--CoA ligase [Myxococcales bacterium]|nr:acetate--CoA ligase [Myxococcales bacterium]